MWTNRGLAGSGEIAGPKDNRSGAAPVRCLIVDDDRALASKVQLELAALGFRCDTISRLTDADLALASIEYDAIIFEIAVSGGEGLDWLRNRQRSTQFPPVLICTSRASLEDRVAGLDAGADDYLSKPVTTAEIAAHLRALLRRAGPRRKPNLVAGSLVFDVAARSAFNEGVRLPLTLKEAELLEILMRRIGTVVSKCFLNDSLNRLDQDVTTNAIEALVSRLRQKLRSERCSSEIITIHGVGYMLEESPADRG